MGHSLSIWGPEDYGTPLNGMVDDFNQELGQFPRSVL